MQLCNTELRKCSKQKELELIIYTFWPKFMIPWFLKDIFYKHFYTLEFSPEPSCKWSELSIMTCDWAIVKVNNNA